MNNSPMERFTVASVSLYICNYWGNPDGVEAHVLYVIEFVNDTLVVSAAVFSVVGVARRARTIWGSKPVSDKL